LEIADLTAMEARVKVDETEVVKVALAQTAEIKIDAFADAVFAGRVSEIGNSPIYTSAGASQQAVDFEVKVTLLDQVPHIRPGLSCKAEIKVATRDSALAVPLGSVTVRKWPPEERLDRRRRGQRPRGRTAATEEVAPADSAAAKPSSEEVQREEKEGVFVVSDGLANFRPVEIGIAGEDDFEVLAGLSEDETVITGPFRILRDLKHGDAVKKGKADKDRQSQGD
jgi:HlyD family secretion protein